MSYRVNIQPINRNFIVDNNETILAAALRQGINLPYGCRSGNCGSCKSILLEGVVRYDHEQSLCLTDQDKLNQAVLLCQAHPTSDLTIEASLIPSNENIIVKKLPCRINEKKHLNHDVIKLLLKLPVTELFEYKAGQYINILLPDGRYRSFSLANAPYFNGSLELHIRLINGGEFTSYVFNEMKEKEILRVEGPHGQFYLREDSNRPIIFMAGGTGFAPIKSIIEYSISHNMDRPMYLYWGVRSQKDLYMDALAKLWDTDFSHIHYIPVLSDPGPKDDAKFRIGLVHKAILEDFQDLSKFDIYASGPPAMIEAAKQEFTHFQLPTDQYFSDAFEFQNP